jgi:hypothetical protein
MIGVHPYKMTKREKEGGETLSLSQLTEERVQGPKTRLQKTSSFLYIPFSGIKVHNTYVPNAESEYVDFFQVPYSYSSANCIKLYCSANEIQLFTSHKVQSCSVKLEFHIH